MADSKYSQSGNAFDEPLRNPEKGKVLGLLKDISVATRIAQAAKQYGLGIHNFDRAQPLVAQMKEEKPALIVLDWDTCELEAHKVLNEIRKDADLKRVMIVGYLSGLKGVLKEEAQRAGCQRVYNKTEFFRELMDLMARSLV